MSPDDNICYCYHVSLRKLVHFARRTRPSKPSQMSDCLSAGTGCGWCIPFLVKIARDPDEIDLNDMSPDNYAEQRQTYIREQQPKNEF